MHNSSRTLLPLACGALAAFAGPRADATWSIVLADSNTKEVAIGSVTCLTSFDLLAAVPVMVVGVGGGACQAAADPTGIRRPIIHDQLLLGIPPPQIITMLAGVTGHQQRQYGIVDTRGGTATFTGTQTSQWAGGVTGNVGSLYYSIQGNILAGSCVVPAIQQAIITTSGDVPAKLMAGMQAARQTGGDGRCSCTPAAPTSCGCPPASFNKSGHIGTLLTARIGDIDDTLCSASGCADGNYFMKFNVAFQPTSAPDPVVQLQQQFDSWRAAHVGRPDAIQSVVAFSPAGLPIDGTSTTKMTITLRDWQQLPITAPITSLTVEHAPAPPGSPPGDVGPPGSAGITTIGTPVAMGGGVYSVGITAGTRAGIDRYRITVGDGIRLVVLMSDPALSMPLGDLSGDGLVNGVDLAALLAAWTGGSMYNPCPPFRPADLNHDCRVNGLDLAALLAAWTG